MFSFLAMPILAAHTPAAHAGPLPAKDETVVTAPAAKAPPHLLLLGTGGGPGGKRDRAGIATLLVVNGRNYLIDGGAGLDRQLASAGFQEADVDVVFLTHLHDDHTAGLPAWMTFAYTRELEGPAKRVPIFGPPHVTDYVAAADALLQVNADIRQAEQGRTREPRSQFLAHQYAPPSVYKDDNISVSAIENTHYHLSGKGRAAENKSYSLRFTIGGRSVVFTGDTGPNAKLAAFAKDTDVLVSEMVTRKLGPTASAADILHVEREHLSPHEVGSLAKASGAKLLILSHVGRVSDADVAEVKAVFTGRIVVGTDLAEIAMP